MRDAQKPDHVSLNTLIDRLKEGKFVIPDFQREFEWQPWDIRELMRSIFLDYYIGSLLLWKSTKESYLTLSCEPIEGFDGEGKPEFIVLDGQQRLTAMYYAFLATDKKLPKRESIAFFYISVDKLMNEIYDEAFNYEWISRRTKKILSDRNAQYLTHMFPLSIIGAGGWDLYGWVQGYEQFWLARAKEHLDDNDEHLAEEAINHAENAKEFGSHLKGITEQYQVSYIELDKDLEIDKVCDIFTQINSRGVRLDVFDLMNALLKPKDLQLKWMWRAAAPRLEFVDTEKMNVYILQVMSILRQGYCSPKYLYFLLPGQEKSIREPDGTRRKEILIPSVKDFEKRWNNAVKALEDAIKILRHPQEFGAISSKYLPYVSILPVFAALQSHVKSLPSPKQLDAQRKIRRWYWSAVFTNRYSGAVESTSARDFVDMKAWFENDSAEPALIQDFKSRFKSLDLRTEIKRGTSVYNGIFNLLVLQGARDWMTGNVPQYDDLDDHHIVPASWGAKNLEKKNSVHTILNRTPLTANTNRKIINDRLPNEYLPELIRDNGENAVREILDSHFISPTAQEILLRIPFTNKDFEEFIAERQRTFHEAIENLLIKERLRLSPALRELDGNIEEVELDLRQLIATTLTNHHASLPSQVLENIDIRIQSAAKKNAALDTEYYQSLEGKLEYADLRDLQAIVTNKALWGLFETRFLNKVTLEKKFDQLSELRNGIRHSRKVDVVTQKEGEAALVWFNQVLSK